MLLPFAAYAAETRIGISAALSNFESSGTETLKSSSNKTNKTVKVGIIGENDLLYYIKNNYKLEHPNNVKNSFNYKQALLDNS